MADNAIPKDVIRAYKAISDKAEKYDLLWKYYDGEQPLVYSTARLREIFQKLDARFTQNWAAVVIDAAQDRISFKKFDVTKNTEATDLLAEIYQDTDLGLEADEAHRAAQVCGEGFIIAWKNADGENEIYNNDPRQCHVFYDEDNPRKASYAAKCWVDADGYAHLTIYYDDQIEYYKSTKLARNMHDGKSFAPFTPKGSNSPVEKNPYGKIPVFHYRLERRRIKSALANVIGIEDAIDKLMSDMMVSAEYGAFPQRVIISSSEIVGKMKNAPNEVTILPGGDGVGQDTSINQFSPTDLANYLGSIDKLVLSIGVISATPKHYFMATGGDPSGEALIAMEAPLNKKCQRYIDNFIPTWRHLGAFLLELNGMTGVDDKDIKPEFEKPETVQPRTAAEIRQLNVASGMPLETTLRVFDHWSDKEIEDMHKERDANPAPVQPSSFGSPSPPQSPRDTALMQANDVRRQARQQLMAGSDNGNNGGAAGPARAGPVKAGAG